MKFNFFFILIFVTTTLLHCTNKSDETPLQKKTKQSLVGKNEGTLMIAKEFIEKNERYFPLNSLHFAPGPFPFIQENIRRKNILDAIEIWQKDTIAKYSNWRIFSEWVLPPRILDPTPEDWRILVHDKYDTIVKSVKFDYYRHRNLICLLNNDVRKWFKFNSAKSPNRLSHLLSTQGGDCRSMSLLLAYLGRTYGVPVAIDYVDSWANVRGGNHHWNSIVKNCHESTPFMGAESNPGEYSPFLIFKIDKEGYQKSTYKKAAKVFRFTYSNFDYSLNKHLKKNDIPINFRHTNYLDVTNQYFITKDIKIPKQNTNALDTSFAFLCVYNSVDWIPIFWAEPTSNNSEYCYTFKNMPTDVLYMPAYYRDNIVVPFGFPLRQHSKSGKNHFYIPDSTKRISIKIKFLESLEQEQTDLYGIAHLTNWKLFLKKQTSLMKNLSRRKPKIGARYKLYYWNGHWIQNAEAVCQVSGLIFHDVPSNSVYKIICSAEERESRLFTYEDQKQLWW